MRKILFAAVAAALAVAAGPASAKDWKKIRIGVEGAYAPFSEVTPDGTLKGFDIDIAKALCAEMKAECELVVQDWDGMIPALQAKKFDAIVASMSITEERKQKVDFTNKYYNTPARLVRKKGSAIEATKEGLKGKVIGVQQETIHDRYATDTYGEVAEIKRYGTQDQVYLDMRAGRLDVMLADSIVLDEGFLKTDGGGDYEFFGPALTDRAYFGDGAGIAIRKEDDELEKKLNDAIAAIRKDGTYDRIQKQYFAFDIYGD